MITRQEVKLVNCAGCMRPKIGLSMQRYLPHELAPEARLLIQRLGFMHERINDRPYCKKCADRVNALEKLLNGYKGVM